jgi:hypothetical protein
MFSTIEIIVAKCLNNVFETSNNMRYMGKMVATLLLLTVFFIRMSSELLNNSVGINREFVFLLLVFCASIIFWLIAIVFEKIDTLQPLQLLAATFGLFFIAIEYFISYNMDLVALLSAFILFAVCLGRRGNSGGEQMHSTMSTYTVASNSSQGVPVSIIRDYSPPTDDVIIEEDMVDRAENKSAIKKNVKKLRNDNKVKKDRVNKKSPIKLREGVVVEFVASKRGKFYHNVNSDWAKKIKKSNRIEFSNKEEAWEAGYKAHRDLN